MNSAGCHSCSMATMRSASIERASHVTVHVYTPTCIKRLLTTITHILQSEESNLSHAVHHTCRLSVRDDQITIITAPHYTLTKMAKLSFTFTFPVEFCGGKYYSEEMAISGWQPMVVILFILFFLICIERRCGDFPSPLLKPT